MARSPNDNSDLLDDERVTPYYSPRWDLVTRVRAATALGLIVVVGVGATLLLVRKPGCPGHPRDQWCIDDSMYSPHTEAAWMTIGLGSFVALLVLIATVRFDRRRSRSS